MPHKAKSKDKGKAPQTQPTKPESPKPSAKLMSSAILAAKPIKSWYEAVIEEEETTKPPQVQTNVVQHWVYTISKSPELLLALKRCPNRPQVTPYLKQVVFPNPFQNPKEAFMLQNPSFLYNKPVFQKPNPNIFSKLISKIF
jgi:hypothetical protein